MINSICKSVYAQPLSKIIFFIFLMVFVWAKLAEWSKQYAAKEKVWKILNAVLWFGMILVIIGITLSSRNVGAEEVQWQPFYSFQAAKQQPEIYRSMLMNVFMFFPLGLTLPYTLPKSWKCKGMLTILFGLVVSIGIEYLQYHFHLGRAETDDVICNTLGAAIGTLSYVLGNVIQRKKIKEGFLNSDKI